MNRFNRKALPMASAASFLAIAVAAAPARADTAAPIPTAPAADAADPGAAKVEEVTVFARKRAENVQTVPIPITVLTAQELAQQNLQNFSDFQYKFPSFSVYLTNPKQLNLGIRGIGNNGFNTDGIDSSVGVFVDGVYTGRPGMVSGDFNDIAQIDLLRGPQGTLFGKNTTAGAVIINTQKPSFTPAIDAEATGGDYGLQEYKLNVTGPLIDGKLAARLSLFDNDRDGDYHNAYPGGAAANAREGEGARLQLLATPTDNFTFRLIGAVGSQAFNTISPVTVSVYNPAALQARMAAAGYTLVTGSAANPTININAPQNTVTHSNAISGQADYDMGQAGTLTSITAYEAWTCYTNNDNDYTQLNALSDYGSCNRENQFSEEARWASAKGGPLESVVGTFFSHQDLEVDSRVRFGNQYNIWAANPSTSAFPNIGSKTWASGAYANALNGFGIASVAHFHTDTQAIFGNTTWHPDADRKWSIDVGLRETWEEKSMSYDGAVTSNPGGLSTAQINVMSAAGANAQLGQANAAVSDSSLSGQAAVSYRFTPSIMGYVQFARGYKSKGFNLLPENSTNPDPNVALAIAHGASQAIKGETTNDWEAGLKTEWLSHRLLLNGTIFDTLVMDAQAQEAIGVGNTATKFLANVGAERSEGVELEGEAFPIAGLHLKGFLAYDWAYYDSFRNSVCPPETTALTCNLTGREVAWAPKWTSDLTAEYSRTIIPNTTSYGILDANWRSEQNTTIILDPLANIKPYALLNLRVGTLLQHNSVDIQFWIENLMDKHYYINLLGLTKSTGIVQGYPGDPRTFGVTAKVRF